MRITKFWAKGFRSLADVTLDPLGDFNVFYGPNGSGKSNVLVAIRTLFDLAALLGAAAHNRKIQSGLDTEFPRIAGKRADDAQVLRARDFRAGDLTKRLVLGAECQAVDVGGAVDADLAMGHRLLRSVTIEVVADWQMPGNPRVGFSLLSFDGEKVDGPALDALANPAYADLCAFLPRLSALAYELVDADRMPRVETTVPSPSDVQDAVAWHLRAGRLKNALFVAQNSPDSSMRDRSKVLRGLLQEKPFERRPFDVVQDPITQEVDVREPLAAGDVSLDLMGLGIAQLYSLLASIVLVEARTIGIEEPEAHLHAPTTGRMLRAVLQRLVERGIKRQLFIATHSNLFDLDPSGYWDVSMLNGVTHVERKPLDEIDARHVYEPGPAKHALAQLLRYAPAEEVVFRRPDGIPVTAGEMLRLLAEDDDIAVEFLRNLHGAALRVVRLDARRGDGT